MRVILIILLILVIFMALILLGLSDACANDIVKNQAGHIHLVMSVLIGGMKPFETTLSRLMKDGNQGLVDFVCQGYYRQRGE